MNQWAEQNIKNAYASRLYGTIGWGNMYSTDSDGGIMMYCDSGPSLDPSLDPYSPPKLPEIEFCFYCGSEYFPGLSRPGSCVACGGPRGCKA